MNSADTSPGPGARPALAPDDPFVVQPGRLADRLLARALGASLDQRLAAGCRPEETRLLAARAQRIVSLRHRASLARSWDHLLRVARRGPTPRTPAVRLNVRSILAAEPAIRELVNRLSAALPVAAGGVAAATVLLTDATSPVYDRPDPDPDALAERLDAAIAELDPARPLIDAA